MLTYTEIHGHQLEFFKIYVFTLVIYVVIIVIVVLVYLLCGDLDALATDRCSHAMWKVRQNDKKLSLKIFFRINPIQKRLVA